jgi:lysophospholipase L1-like esterase
LDVPCDHYKARLAAIESIIAQRGTEPAYLAIGDSSVELADLPTICGRRPINAGIGWATTNTFALDARRFADLAKPDFVVVALGTNDALQGMSTDFQLRLSALLASLSPWPVVVAPLPPGPAVQDANKLNDMIDLLGFSKTAKRLDRPKTMPDGIHLTAESYADWKKSISDAAEESACR